MIKLIINADDFGMSKVFNKSILDLLEKEFIKSTTVMVNRITKDQNKQIKHLIKLQDTKEISVGLHLEFDIEKPIYPQIKEEYEKFISIFNFSPSHLDIHKILLKRIIEQVNEFAQESNLPVRNHGTTSKTKQTTEPAFLPSKFSVNEIINFIKNLKENSSCEIVTHPGKYDPDCNSSLNKKREIEYENIIKLQDFLNSNPNIKNISYLGL